LGHAQIENKTPFVFEPLHLMDEDCRPLLVPVLKASFDVDDSGRCRLAAEQIPLRVAGEYNGADPESASFRYEPEVAFHKVATDVVFVGDACASRPHTREMVVRVRVGPVGKEVLVLGDRVWFSAAGLPMISEPQTFERIPLVYERAFGGWDRRDADPARHAVEPRNPVGTGFSTGEFEEGLRLPNVEDPGERIRAPKDAPAPAGVGFTSPHWSPRADLAGSFDEAWQRSRAPALPKDFDRRHLSAASPGLIAPGYLRGDEAVVAEGMTPSGAFACTLPGLAEPEATVTLVGREPRQLRLALDTVIVEPESARIVLLWRSHLRLRLGAHDVERVSVRLSRD
jgi:hypothetical protein